MSEFEDVIAGTSVVIPIAISQVIDTKGLCKIRKPEQSSNGYDGIPGTKQVVSSIN